ncbi:MAG: HD domain-containing protein [Actinomycetota bacterium]|nr:HD domain-containing protein [Actinomycetota bacterium]
MDIHLSDPRHDRLARSIAERVAERGGRARYVGGAVRDHLLGLRIEDLDIEVIGLGPDDVHAAVGEVAKVSLVGSSFGVFKVHGAPIDVSLPRTERKVGRGHRGFEVEVDPHLPPERAAARRDFTINAIAVDPLTDEVVDPFGGRADLDARVLRHTSDQFREDPLRVLRGMQFVARFGLAPAPATVAVAAGIEPEGLAPERVFEEWSKLVRRGVAIGAGLEFLRATGWHHHTPELAALVGVPQDPEWHPEGDVWTHTGHVMDAFAAARLGDDEEDLVVGFACLCHDLGKPATTAWIDGRWRSPGHEAAGVPPTRAFIGSMTNQRGLADDVARLVADHLKPDQLYQADSTPRAVRRLAQRVVRLDRLLRVAHADRNGRPPAPDDGFPAADWLREQAAALDVADRAPEPIVRGRDLIDLGLAPGPQFKRLLDACFEAQLDGDVTSVDDGLALVRRLLDDI